jgi:hypothetical protein
MEQVQQLEEIRDTRPNAKPPRGVRCKVRVENTNSQQQVSGYLVPPGVSELVILKKDLPIVMGLVESEPEKLKMAHEVAALAYKTALEKFLKGVPAAQVANKTAEFDAEWPGTPQSEFRRLTGGARDAMPFISAKVIEDDLPEAVDEDRMAVERVHAQTMGREIRAALNETAQDRHSQKR